ncbi:DUF2726 domain-containing protein [Rhodoferax sp. 4810]|uniref:DUF2726 domain-containing protein n=1 Tax=Thiospirillum jenense TaxID=1653858 RepID=A0A839HG26_9GAMM|nr:DUF2726 domain-containing protein [Thiospirillum jenense]MBB1074218.1 DUF2726 domain-containing protein [Rhodoferax jenense]MBB1125292.1 DUF2726 domain-containing protein [Thiospirillum jenense]
MEPFYLLVIIGVVLITNILLTILTTLGVLWRSPERHFIYERRLPFLRPVAQRCLAVLSTVIGNEYRVFSKVALTALMITDERQPHYRTARSYLHHSGLWADFVICGVADGHPLCVILLVPTAPLTRAQQRQLEFLRHSCESAHLPVVMIQEQAQYELDTLRNQISEAIMRADPRRQMTGHFIHEEEEMLLAALAAAMRDR